jgi:LysM repeat protein
MFALALIHTVKSGDTLYLIAKRNGISLNSLRKVGSLNVDGLLVITSFNVLKNPILVLPLIHMVFQITDYTIYFTPNTFIPFPKYYSYISPHQYTICIMMW